MIEIKIAIDKEHLERLIELSLQERINRIISERFILDKLNDNKKLFEKLILLAIKELIKDDIKLILKECDIKTIDLLKGKFID